MKVCRLFGVNSCLKPRMFFADHFHIAHTAIRHQQLPFLEVLWIGRFCTIQPLHRFQYKIQTKPRWNMTRIHPFHSFHCVRYGGDGGAKCLLRPPFIPKKAQENRFLIQTTEETAPIFFNLTDPNFSVRHLHSK